MDIFSIKEQIINTDEILKVHQREVEEYEKAKRACQLLKKKLDQTKSTLKYKDDELKKIRFKAEQLKSSCDRSKEELDKLNTEHWKLTGNFSSLEQSYNKTVNDLNIKLQSAYDQLETYKRWTQQHGCESQIDPEKIKKSKDGVEVKNLRKRNQQLKNKVNSLLKQLKDYKTTPKPNSPVSTVDNVLDENFVHSLADKEDSIGDSGTHSIQEDYEMTFEDFRPEISCNCSMDNNLKLQKMESGLATKQKEIDDITKNFNLLETQKWKEIDSLQTQLNGTKRSNLQLETKIKNLTENNEKLKTEIKEMMKKSRQSEKIKDSLVNLEKDYMQKMHKLESEKDNVINALNIQLNTSAAIHKSLSEENKKLEAIVIRYRKEVEENRDVPCDYFIDSIMNEMNCHISLLSPLNADPVEVQQDDNFEISNEPNLETPTQPISPRNNNKQLSVTSSIILKDREKHLSKLDQSVNIGDNETPNVTKPVEPDGQITSKEHETLVITSNSSVDPIELMQDDNTEVSNQPNLETPKQPASPRNNNKLSVTSSIVPNVIEKEFSKMDQSVNIGHNENPDVSKPLKPNDQIICKEYQVQTKNPKTSADPMEVLQDDNIEVTNQPDLETLKQPAIPRNNNELSVTSSIVSEVGEKELSKLDQSVNIGHNENPNVSKPVEPNDQIICKKDEAEVKTPKISADSMEVLQDDDIEISNQLDLETPKQPDIPRNNNNKLSVTSSIVSEVREKELSKLDQSVNIGHNENPNVSKPVEPNDQIICKEDEAEVKTPKISADSMEVLQDDNIEVTNQPDLETPKQPAIPRNNNNKLSVTSSIVSEVGEKELSKLDQSVNIGHNENPNVSKPVEPNDQIICKKDEAEVKTPKISADSMEVLQDDDIEISNQLDLETPKQPAIPRNNNNKLSVTSSIVSEVGEKELSKLDQSVNIGHNENPNVSKPVEPNDQIICKKDEAEVKTPKISADSMEVLQDDNIQASNQLNLQTPRQLATARNNNNKLSVSSSTVPTVAEKEPSEMTQTVNMTGKENSCITKPTEPNDEVICKEHETPVKTPKSSADRMEVLQAGNIEVSNQPNLQTSNQRTSPRNKKRKLSITSSIVPKVSKKELSKLGKSINTGDNENRNITKPTESNDKIMCKEHEIQAKVPKSPQIGLRRTTRVNGTKLNSILKSLKRTSVAHSKLYNVQADPDDSPQPKKKRVAHNPKEISVQCCGPRKDNNIEISNQPNIETPKQPTSPRNNVRLSITSSIVPKVRKKEISQLDQSVNIGDNENVTKPTGPNDQIIDKEHEIQVKTPNSLPVPDEVPQGNNIGISNQQNLEAPKQPTNPRNNNKKLSIISNIVLKVRKKEFSKLNQSVNIGDNKNHIVTKSTELNDQMTSKEHEVQVKTPSPADPMEVLQDESGFSCIINLRPLDEIDWGNIDQNVGTCSRLSPPKSRQEDVEPVTSEMNKTEQEPGEWNESTEGSNVEPEDPNRPKSPNESESCILNSTPLDETDSGNIEQNVGTCSRLSPPELRQETIELIPSSRNKDNVVWRKKTKAEQEPGEWNERNKCESTVEPEDPKRPKSSIKAEPIFKELLNFSQESAALNDIVKKCTNKEADGIARTILQEVSKDDCSSSTSDGLAPLMSPVQQIMLGFMVRLEREGVESVCDKFLVLAKNRLIMCTKLEQVLPITRLYVGVCKFKRYIHTLRLLCYDFFYFRGDLAVPFLFDVLKSWPEVLPHYSQEQDRPLARVMIQAVNMSTSNKPDDNLMPLRSLLVKYYKYPADRWNSDEMFLELLDRYLEHPDRSKEFPILLFCKNHPSKWVYKKLQEQIKPIFLKNSYDNMKEAVIVLIVNLSDRFSIGVEEDEVYLNDIRTWLSGLLLTDGTPDVVKRHIHLYLSRSEDRGLKDVCGVNKYS